MGKHIAFQGTLRGTRITPELASGPSVYVLDPETSSLRQMTTNLQVISFAWSPDGQHLACIASRGFIGAQWTETLYLADADGGHLRRITDEYGGVTYHWSPDGRKLALACYEEDYRSAQRHGKLSILDVEQGETRQITDEAAFVVWSPETSDIAFLWSHDAHNIFLMDADGANRRRLFHSDLAMSPHSWSPDGTLLALYVWSRSQWGAGYEDRDSLYLIGHDGNIVFQGEWGGEWGASYLTWSPDSQRLACIGPYQYYEDEEDEEDDFLSEHQYVYTLERDGSALEALAPTTYERGVAWSPDSQKLAFIHEDNDEYSLGIIDLAGQHMQTVPITGQDFSAKLDPGTPSWSSDSRQVAYTTRGLQQIYVVAADGTNPRCVTDTLSQPGYDESQEQEGTRVAEDHIIHSLAWQP